MVVPQMDRRSRILIKYPRLMGTLYFCVLWTGVVFMMNTMHNSLSRQGDSFADFIFIIGVFIFAGFWYFLFQIGGKRNGLPEPTMSRRKALRDGLLAGGIAGVAADLGVLLFWPRLLPVFAEGVVAFVLALAL